jgi:hypothetical protein
MKRGTKVLWGAVVAVPFAIVAWVYLHPEEPDGIDKAVRSIGFYPITPPSNLRGPGSIYYVSPDGNYYSLLCEVEPDRLKRVWRSSPTAKQVSNELKKAKVGLGADVLNRVSSSADADLLQTIKLELDEVEVGEVSLEELATIADELLKRTPCAQQVERYLHSDEYVCQGQQVLKATTNYSVEFNDAAKASVKRPVPEGGIKDAAQVIKANVDADARVEGSKILSGKGLYYGIKLAPRCMYLPGKKGRRPPLGIVQRFLNFVGWD